MMRYLHDFVVASSITLSMVQLCDYLNAVEYDMN